MRALKFITGHVIYNPAYAYKFQLKITIVPLNSSINKMISLVYECILGNLAAQPGPDG